MMYSVGETTYLSRDVGDEASGDSPARILGERGDEVYVIDTFPDKRFGKWDYLVKIAPTKSFYVESSDLMFTKPFSYN